MPRLEANVSEEFYEQLKAAAEQAERPLASIVREASRMWLHSFENGTANRASVTALGADPARPVAVPLAEPPSRPLAPKPKGGPDPKVKDFKPKREIVDPERPPARATIPPRPVLSEVCTRASRHAFLQTGEKCLYCQGFAP